MSILNGKRALLLDMNSTFMFGEDRFGDDQDYSVSYRALGGELPAGVANTIIRDAYQYLDVRYPDEDHRHCFPSVEQAIRAVVNASISDFEVQRLVDTFADHELGHILDNYASTIVRLSEKFVLAAVIDIWSPKRVWLEAFDRAGIGRAFSAISFSSDHGMVKPSPRPFELVLQQLDVSAEDAVVIGDSVRRDLGGARQAGISCILVGGAEHPDALACVDSLLVLLNPIDGRGSA